MADDRIPGVSVGRRAWLQDGALLLASAATLDPASLFAADDREMLRIGLVTDLHYADKPPAGSRHYRETLGKFTEATEQFAKSKVSFLVELGDLIDAADSVDTEKAYLKTISREFLAAGKDRHCVLGNHCVDTLTKEEFLGGVEQERSYYSFDRGEHHFVVLDACFRSDGENYGRKNSQWTDANVPATELEWLAGDLKSTDRPTVVFAHQRLDVANNYGIKNAPKIREILEKSGKVQAVFQGHSHKNDLNEINGIPYCTLVAMVEGAGADSSGYSVLEIAPGGAMRLQGFRNQKSQPFQKGT